MFADDVAVRARYFLAKTYFFRGDNPSALAAFEALLADNPSGPQWVIAWTHLRLGQIYDMEGRRQEAVAEYRRTLDMKKFGETHNAAKRWLKEPFEGWSPRTEFRK
jgi:tetratricopeptide (TPR) repeat protein